jgi:hypothetical protein
MRSSRSSSSVWTTRCGLDREGDEAAARLGVGYLAGSHVALAAEEGRQQLGP